jgi:hypothetical protein
MSLPIQRIRAQLQEVNHSLFQIKDLTAIISRYTISFPNKVVQKRVTGIKPWEVKFSNGIVVISTRYENDNRKLECFAVHEDGTLLSCSNSISLDFLNSSLPNAFDIDFHSNKLILATDDNTLHLVGIQGRSIQTLSLNSVAYDVVMDVKNDAFYVMLRDQHQELLIGSLRTNTIVGERIVLGGFEMKLCSSLNLLAIRSHYVIVVYRVPEFTIEFKIFLGESVSIQSCMCFSQALNSLIVALPNSIMFYSLDTGLLNKKENMRFNEPVHYNGICYDEKTGFLILVDFDSNCVLVVG